MIFMNNVLSRLSKVYQLSKKNNGIIRVYDFDLDSCSYTMERADSTLENFVKASSLSDESKINIIRPIVHTISLVHQRGVLHRDLSPTNIFFVDNIIKLADFGLGKNLNTLTSHQTMGTASFVVLGAGNLQVALLLDGVSFLLSFVLVWSIRVEEVTADKEKLSLGQLFKEMKEGAQFISHQKELFFLLMVASLVNAFIAALNYLLPFSDQLFNQSGSYALILSFGAGGAICGALVAKKVPSTMAALLVSLALSGSSLMIMGLGLPIPLIWLGYFLFECFLTIFNIHFFSQVQSRVPNDYLGRVISSIFTLAILFMPLGTLLMTILPKTVQPVSFVVIGLGIVGFALGSLLYLKRFMRENF